MKAVKIVLLIAVVLVAVLMVAAFIFIKTFDLNRYKPQIISRASEALGRPVDFSRVDLTCSLGQGVSMRLSDLAIGEDPAYAKGDFLTVKDVSLGVDVLGYIFERKINIPSIFLDAPRVTIIRSGDGSINLNKIGRIKEKDEDRDISVPTIAKLPALLISSVKATGGNLTYIDRLFKPPMTIEVKGLDVEASKISLTDSFPFSVEAAVFSDEKNVVLGGYVGYDLLGGELTIRDLKGTIDLDQLLLQQIARDLPMTKNFSFPTSLRGKALLSLQQMSVGAKGLTGLSAEVSLQGASIKLKEMNQALQDVEIVARVTENDIFVKDASARIGEGNIAASGAIGDYVSKQNYQIQATAQDLDLSDIINQEGMPVNLSGGAAIQLNLKGMGFSPSNINSNLSGQAEISLFKPTLKDVNVLRTVLDKISVIPGLSQDVEANLPERFKEKMTQKDTVFSDVRLPVTVADGRMSLMDAVIQADEFTFKGNGEVGFDGAFAVEGEFLIPRDLSEAMLAAADELQFLLNRDNQIYIPLRVAGDGNALAFYVDAAYMAHRIVMEQGKRQLFEVIDKALGGEKKAEEGAASSTTEGKDTQDDGSLESEEPTTEEQIKDFLREIF